MLFLYSLSGLLIPDFVVLFTEESSMLSALFINYKSQLL